MLNQTYKNIEIIICDDCSTNGVYEYLIERYGTNEKITIIRNEKNSSIGVSSNNCIALARGEFIAKQDDDDYSDLTRIEKQVMFLLNNPEYDLVSCGFCKFDDLGEWDKYIPKEKPTKRDFRIYNQHVHAATLFRKSCLEEVNGYRIAKETVRGEDYDLFMRIYACNKKGYNLQEVLYYYNFPRGNSRKIKYKYKINEAKIRFKGFKAMKLPLRDYIYLFKPLIAGLMSENLKRKIKKKINK